MIHQVHPLLTNVPMAKILIIEDDNPLAENIAQWLSSDQHSVDIINDGGEAIEHLKYYNYDIIILDWELPSLAGVEVCSLYRSTGGSTPILMLTGKSELDDKELGLDSGADDYLTKPFKMRELSARIRALLRRSSGQTSNVLKAGAICMNLASRSVTINDNEIRLLPKEFALLEFFILHPNEVFSSEALVERVWKSTSDVSPDAVRTYITRLRAKIDLKGEKSLLENVHGVGYKLRIETH